MRTFTALVVAALVATALAGAAPVEADVAIIVSRDNPTDDLTLAELERILRQDRRYWRASQPIRVLMPRNDAPARQVILRAVLKKSENEYQQFMVGRLFRGEIAAMPRVMGSAAELRQVVASDPNAVGFLEVGDLDATVKALRIDGSAPSTPGYPLR